LFDTAALAVFVAIMKGRVATATLRRDHGPDSPDFNPIENAFAKLKALLRARAERTIQALWDAVGSIIDLITPAECANFFKAAGYKPD